ncbi:hypothetical protein CANINC_004566 [Pichia inconspicua]|uniref:Ribosomal protein S21 n=1 Tax=Pichia inconspicua TaxID=52247 RepID=A0A4T0WVS0_9ASCO|nr:hypothetical protein CANINC_004566 [[Candida] inconspicua]
MFARVSRFGTVFVRHNSQKTSSIIDSLKATAAKNNETSSINKFINKNLGEDAPGSFYSNKRVFEPIFDAEPDPYDYATRFVVQDKIAGRSVNVMNKDLDRAISQLDSLTRSSKLREISQYQRFFTKPNKRRLAKKIANRKKVFETGIAKLFEVVRDAVRKGY